MLFHFSLYMTIGVLGILLVLLVLYVIASVLDADTTTPGKPNASSLVEECEWDETPHIRITYSFIDSIPNEAMKEMSRSLQSLEVLILTHYFYTQLPLETRHRTKQLINDYNLLLIAYVKMSEIEGNNAHASVMNGLTTARDKLNEVSLVLTKMSQTNIDKRIELIHQR